MSFLLSTIGQQYNRNSSKTFHSRVSSRPHLCIYLRLLFLGQINLVRYLCHISICFSSSSTFIWGSVQVHVSFEVSQYILLYRFANSFNCFDVNIFNLNNNKLFSFSSCCCHSLKGSLSILFSSDTCSNSICRLLWVSLFSDTIR